MPPVVSFPSFHSSPSPSFKREDKVSCQLSLSLTRGDLASSQERPDIHDALPEGPGKQDGLGDRLDDGRHSQKGAQGACHGGRLRLSHAVRLDVGEVGRQADEQDLLHGGLQIFPVRSLPGKDVLQLIGKRPNRLLPGTVPLRDGAGEVIQQVDAQGQPGRLPLLCHVIKRTVPAHQAAPGRLPGQICLLIRHLPVPGHDQGQKGRLPEPLHVVQRILLFG